MRQNLRPSRAAATLALTIVLALSGCSSSDSSSARIYVHIQISDSTEACDAEAEQRAEDKAALGPRSSLRSIPPCKLPFMDEPAYLLDESGEVIGVSDEFEPGSYGFWAADVYSEPTDSLTQTVRIAGCDGGYELGHYPGTREEELALPDSGEPEEFVVEEYYLNAEGKSVNDLRC